MSITSCIESANDTQITVWCLDWPSRRKPNPFRYVENFVYQKLKKPLVNQFFSFSETGCLKANQIRSK